MLNKDEAGSVLERLPLLRFLPPDVRTAVGDVPAGTLESAERRHIARVLERTGGNKRRAARLLGLARSTLDRKLRT